MLQEDPRLIDFQISKNSTISLMHCLRGGAKEKRVPFDPSSYKESAHHKGSQTTASSSSQPSPYLVEKLESTQTLEIKNPQVKQLFSTLQSVAIIYCFKGFGQDLLIYINGFSPIGQQIVKSSYVPRASL